MQIRIYVHFSTGNIPHDYNHWRNGQSYRGGAHVCKAVATSRCMPASSATLAANWAFSVSSTLRWDSCAAKAVSNCACARDTAACSSAFSWDKFCGHSKSQKCNIRNWRTNSNWNNFFLDGHSRKIITLHLSSWPLVPALLNLFNSSSLVLSSSSNCSTLCLTDANSFLSSRAASVLPESIHRQFVLILSNLSIFPYDQNSKIWDLRTLRSFQI